MNKQVPDEVLLHDIELTKQELGAYNKLAEGFSVLASLPENIGNEARKYRWQFERYEESAKGCKKFLDKLEGLKLDRGLKDEEQDE